MAEQQAHLKRSLGLWAIVGLGLGYMTPTVVFDTFGIVSNKTNGLVPLTYLVALAVMLFTAISYGRMVRMFPSAGSAYVYVKETMHPALGFLVGWTSLLDYLLLPLVNAVIIRIYMVAVFPGSPAWLWVSLYVAAVTAINVVSMGKTSRANMILLVYEVILIAVFIALAWSQLRDGLGAGTIFTLRPLFHEGAELTAILAGATVVAFSFIGFDAITMYTEEAVDEKTVPRAIMLTVLIGGALFFIGGYFAQAAFPTVEAFSNTDDTLPELALFIGGKLFMIIFLSGAFAATCASGLASHSSVARLLYVMGRNKVLPRRLFGYIHPTFRTPAFNVILVGVVSLLAMGPSLELIASVINFGALIAFTFVNLSVIACFVFHEKRYRSAGEIFRNILLPMVGAGLTGVLWVHLGPDALVGGIVWFVIGLVYLAFLTGFFRRPVPNMSIEEAVEDGYIQSSEAVAGSAPGIATSHTG